MKVSGKQLYEISLEIPFNNLTIFFIKKGTLHIKEIRSKKYYVIIPKETTDEDNTNDKVVIRRFKHINNEKTVDLKIDYPYLIINGENGQEVFKSIDWFMPIGFKSSHFFFP